MNFILNGISVLQPRTTFTHLTVAVYLSLPLPPPSYLTSPLSL